MKMIMKKQLCYGFRIILILGNTTPFRDPRTTSFRDTQFCRSGPRFPKFSRSRSGPGLSRTWIPHRSLSGKGPGPVLRPNRLVLDQSVLVRGSLVNSVLDWFRMTNLTGKLSTAIMKVSKIFRSDQFKHCLILWLWFIWR